MSSRSDLPSTFTCQRSRTTLTDVAILGHNAKLVQHGRFLG